MLIIYCLLYHLLLVNLTERDKTRCASFISLSRRSPHTNTSHSAAAHCSRKKTSAAFSTTDVNSFFTRFQCHPVQKFRTPACHPLFFLPHGSYRRACHVLRQSDSYSLACMAGCLLSWSPAPWSGCLRFHWKTTPGYDPSCHEHGFSDFSPSTHPV